MMTPAVSIIICTRDRAESLDQTLKSFEAVNAPAGLRPEILVVDNGSTDHTPAVVRKHSVAKIPIRYLLESSPGQSKARNAGIAATRADVILFTDDDVVPAPDWLESIAAPLLRRECDGVVGRIELAKEICRSWMTPQHQISLAVCDGPREGVLQLVGANMGFHRSVLDRVPEFDVELGPGAFGFADDTLFSWQLVEAGFRLCFVPEASVIHRPDPARLTRSNWLAVGRKHGLSAAYVLHHWEHREISNPRLRSYRAGLKLLLRRMAQPPAPMGAEGIAPWEMSYVVEMEKCRQFIKERHRPRNYSKHGLRKRGQPT
jgi:glycosyltransferase involved in cell wall biosynthesis